MSTGKFKLIQLGPSPGPVGPQPWQGKVTFKLKSIWNPDPVHKSPLFGHMHVIQTPFSYLLSICQILVISLSYPNKKKTSSWHTWYIPISAKTRKDMPKLKKMCEVYTECIFSGSKLHLPVISLAYPCHNCFLFRGMRSTNEIQPVIESLFDFCIPWHSIHQAQQDLFANGAPAGSFARHRRGRRRRGLRHRGVLLRRTCAGAACAGAADVGGFLGVLASARGLGDLSADVVGGIMQFLP